MPRLSYQKKVAPKRRQTRFLWMARTGATLIKHFLVRIISNEQKEFEMDLQESGIIEYVNSIGQSTL